MRISPVIRDTFESLERDDDALTHLRALRGLKTWLVEADQRALEEARDPGFTWEQIGEAQGRARQAVHRQATQTPPRPRVRGLT